MFREAMNAGDALTGLGMMSRISCWHIGILHPTAINVITQRNKASPKGRSLRTGGSITSHEHAIRMVKSFSVKYHILI